MPLKDELCFVQFIHPGGEHRPIRQVSMPWNEKSHKRKFVEINGRCHKNGKPYGGLLRFWGEWEPESDVAEIVEPVRHGPRFIHRPFYVRPTPYRLHQNTDPFVFGDFFYAGCQQNTKTGPTQLRYLENGSVILFGSRVAGQFVVDTVFVVAKSKDYDIRCFKEQLNSLPETYCDVTLKAWSKHNCDLKRGAEPGQLRFYWGATFDNPVDGMFSFFPCLPAEQSKNGFARPVIDLPDVITPNLQQGKRLNRRLTTEQINNYWNAVREQVESQGLWIGTFADRPKQRKE
jgi:hypothetical protein